MLYKPFILLLGVFLGSHRPAEAQTPPPRIVLAQEHFAPVLSILPTSILPTVSTSFRFPLFSFQLFQDVEKINIHFGSQIAGAYAGDFSLEHLSPMNEARTLILTQSSLPLVRFWGGRLELEAFQSTLHLQNGQIAIVGTGGMRDFRLSGQSYPGGPRSLHFSGLSLNIRFGRDVRSGHQFHLWQCLIRPVAAVLN